MISGILHLYIIKNNKVIKKIFVLKAFSLSDLKYILMYNKNISGFMFSEIIYMNTREVK